MIQNLQIPLGRAYDVPLDGTHMRNGAIPKCRDESATDRSLDYTREVVGREAYIVVMGIRRRIGVCQDGRCTNEAVGVATANQLHVVAQEV